MAGPPQNHLLAVRNREQVFDLEAPEPTPLFEGTMQSRTT
jgi:hypothetical protein